MKRNDDFMYSKLSFCGRRLVVLIIKGIEFIQKLITLTQQISHLVVLIYCFQSFGVKETNVKRFPGTSEMHAYLTYFQIVSAANNLLFGRVELS